MFAGDDDDQSVHSFDLSSGRTTQQPHWSTKYSNPPNGTTSSGHVRLGSGSTIGANGQHSRQSSNGNGHGWGNGAGNGGHPMMVREYSHQGREDDEDEFGWSGSAGGIRGRDDRQLERDKEFERQIEERRKKRAARKQAREQTSTNPFTDQQQESLADGATPSSTTAAGGKKAYRPVFAPNESDLRKATASSGGTPPPPASEDRRRSQKFVATRALAEEGPEAQVANQVTPPVSPAQPNAPRRGVTLVDDGVVPPPKSEPENQPVKVSRSKSLKNFVKRPGILRAQSEVVRTPAGAEQGKQYDFLSSPPPNETTFSADTNEAPSSSGGAGLKRGMSLKDKVGAALTRFGSRRDKGHNPSLSASVPASASNGRPAGLQRNATTGGVGMRKSPSGRPRATTTGTIQEGGEGEGAERGSGLMRKLSRKLQEREAQYAQEAAERRRRQEEFFEPPKLSHVLVGAASPFPPRPPLGTTGSDPPPSFHRATNHMGSRPPVAPSGRQRGSSYARTPYNEDKKTIMA